ncbi:hypothetical protein BH09DEP1_BH09DEP1_4930 [soil metagenome]
MNTIIKILFVTHIGLNLCAMDPATALAKRKRIRDPQTVEAQQLYMQAQELIENKRDLNAPFVANGIPLLAQSAQSNEHIATTFLLLFHGANPDVIDGSGKTPLLYAAQNCADKNIAALVYYKANPNHPCYQQRPNRSTPLQALCLPNQDSFDNKKNKARLKAVEWLLAAKADTNARDASGITPIFGLVTCAREKRSSALMSPRKKVIFSNFRKSLINALLACKANLQITDHMGRDLYHQSGHQVDAYLSIYIAIKGNQRREKLRKLLLQFLKGSPYLPDRISPFKTFPPDILRYILKQAYP